MLFCVVTRTLNYVPDYLHAVKEVAVDDSIPKILEVFFKQYSEAEVERGWRRCSLLRSAHLLLR